MIKTGLVSITFRKLSPAQIVDLSIKAKLDAIEWGGDIHVPHGEVKTARQVLRMTQDAGLITSSYGSYYRVGCEEKNLPFQKVLESAVELEAPVIRVWAGDRGSKYADEAWWSKVVDDSNRIADMSEKYNIKIAYEYHGGTLTDTAQTAEKLLKLVDYNNIKCYWQPLAEHTSKMRLEGLNAVMPYLSNIHVFEWDSHKNRYPLCNGIENWKEYMNIIKKAEGDRYAMLEFVRDDDPEQFLQDAIVLRNLLYEMGDVEGD